MKRVPVVFNLDNESQKELYDQCQKKFGKNMSGGIRNVLFTFFHGVGKSPAIIESDFKVNEMESVL